LATSVTRVKSNSKLWRWFFVLAALEAGAAFVALLAVPHESSGYSVWRLAFLTVLAAFFIASVYPIVRPFKRLEKLAQQEHSLGAALTACLLAIALFLLRYLAPERLLPYYQRLSPLLWYCLIVAAEFSLCSLVIWHGLQLAAIKRQTALWRAGGLAFLALLLAFAFVAITKVGTTPDSAYWGEPGAPVLAWELAIAIVCGAAVFLVGLKFRVSRRADLALGVGIWLLAVVIWLSVPISVMKNSFYAPINPPTNQSLPNSDAGYYDSMAHSLLIGYPYQGDIPTRPLYIALLAFLHLLAGEHYDLIIAGQTLVLAFIPVMLYLLGERLHSRSAGIMASLFAIFREWNSLLISSQTRVSNTKTLLVDLPTMLLLLLACLVAVRWLESRARSDALLAGGLLGLLLLLRTQTMLLVPILLVLALPAFDIRNRRWAVPFGLFLLGIAAAMTPWLIHNYLQSGQLTLDAPFEYQVIASQYKYTGNLDISAVDLQGKGLFGLLLTFALRDPKFVVGFITTHFLATLIDSALALPLAAPYNGLFAPLNLYWMDWPAHIDPQNAGFLIPYLAIIAIGLGAAWKRLRWAGLVPLAFALGYALANGIGRFSGWRYDLPADWVAYFYLAIGAAEVFMLFASLFGLRPDDLPASPVGGFATGLNWRKAATLTAAFALVGALPWFAGALSSPRYASDTLPALMAKLTSSHAVQRLQIGDTQIETFVADPQATLQIGRVLYPRYFSRDNGLSSAHPWPAYAVRDFPRMGFLLLNQSRHDALMPLRQIGNFPQGADAIVIGCLRQDHIEVRLILFPDTDTAYLSAPLTQACT
jgi:hypothetical protein